MTDRWVTSCGGYVGWSWVEIYGGNHRKYMYKYMYCIYIYINTMIASVSFVITTNLISNFPQTGQISNFPHINMHEQT